MRIPGIMLRGTLAAAVVKIVSIGVVYEYLNVLKTKRFGWKVKALRPGKCDGLFLSSGGSLQMQGEDFLVFFY